MKRLTGKYKNGTAYYNIVPGESTIERLAAIEDILGDDYDLDCLKNLIKADQEGRCVIFLPWYNTISQYYKENGLCIREVTGVISEKEYKKALKGE